VKNFKSQRAIFRNTPFPGIQLAKKVRERKSRSDSAAVVMQRIEALGNISEEAGRLTRTFCSSAMRKANDLVASWMRQAGMEVRQDAIGNVLGHYASEAAASKILLLGSHLDTVRDAGKFDGPLGVLVAIACVQQFHATGARLPFVIEVVGFADEEGLRYQSTYLGSKALAGEFDPRDLKRKDANGVTMATAIRSFGGNPDALATAKRDRERLLGYVEVHIEQGPVLEKANLSVGVVTAIAGQKRFQCRFVGRAGHAGTVPMNLRADALCAASEFVVAVEAYARTCPGAVATVGQIEALPGAPNVIPGEVSLSLDVRHADNAVRDRVCSGLIQTGKRIAQARTVDMKWTLIHQAQSVACDPGLSKVLSRVVRHQQGKSILLPSGAGHDAAAIAAIAPVAMLFVRCKGGISHHPDELASESDIRIAIAVMHDFLKQLSNSALLA
jgi:allantoate deiminase